MDDALLANRIAGEKEEKKKRNEKKKKEKKKEEEVAVKRTIMETISSRTEQGGKDKCYSLRARVSWLVRNVVALDLRVTAFPPSCRHGHCWSVVALTVEHWVTAWSLVVSGRVNCRPLGDWSLVVG